MTVKSTDGKNRKKLKSFRERETSEMDRRKNVNKAKESDLKTMNINHLQTVGSIFFHYILHSQLLKDFQMSTAFSRK